jgi:threonine/homoserine/homoserine lactone efflux protein
MDLQVIDYFGKGTLLGLAAGFSPGPLTVLVIGETLRHRLRSGLQVATAPILTDIPIILLIVYAVMLFQAGLTSMGLGSQT